MKMSNMIGRLEEDVVGEIALLAKAMKLNADEAYLLPASLDSISRSTNRPVRSLISIMLHSNIELRDYVKGVIKGLAKDFRKELSGADKQLKDVGEAVVAKFGTLLEGRNEIVLQSDSVAVAHKKKMGWLRDKQEAMQKAMAELDEMYKDWEAGNGGDDYGPAELKNALKEIEENAKDSHRIVSSM